jgi:GH25 family lysozyme M1 (1,4-beta-N-acetylmuramidase)
MPKFDVAARRYRLDGLLVSAIQAMEGAGCTVCDCTNGVPWECTMDMARQVWDKARHVEIFLQLLAHVEDAPVIEHALDFVAADDLTHVCMASQWLRELPADAPERLRKALELQQSLAE